ncbi:MAG: hypothetical protein KF729_21940 [Sandaracinaceae bacterium]|nr:hypothetical protein [Sandaracinaceae bacterium]
MTLRLTRDDEHTVTTTEEAEYARLLAHPRWWVVEELSETRILKPIATFPP